MTPRTPRSPETVAQGLDLSDLWMAFIDAVRAQDAIGGIRLRVRIEEMILATERKLASLACAVHDRAEKELREAMDAALTDFIVVQGSDFDRAEFPGMAWLEVLLAPTTPKTNPVGSSTPAESQP